MVSKPAHCIMPGGIDSASFEPYPHNHNCSWDMLIEYENVSLQLFMASCTSP